MGSHISGRRLAQGCTLSLPFLPLPPSALSLSSQWSARPIPLLSPPVLFLCRSSDRYPLPCHLTCLSPWFIWQCSVLFPLILQIERDWLATVSRSIMTQWIGDKWRLKAGRQLGPTNSNESAEGTTAESNPKPRRCGYKESFVQEYDGIKCTITKVPDSRLAVANPR